MQSKARQRQRQQPRRRRQEGVEVGRIASRGVAADGVALEENDPTAGTRQFKRRDRAKNAATYDDNV